MDEWWLPEAVEIMWNLEEKYDIHKVWIDFLYWSACQAGYPYDMLRAESVVESYPTDIVWSFGKLYNLVSKVVHKQPNQNVLLKLAWTMRLTDVYQYDRDQARQMVVQMVNQAIRAPRPLSSSELEQLLQSKDLEGFSVVDNGVGKNAGSFLIAAANVLCELYPKNYQEKAIIIIPRSGRNNEASLMAFIQCSLMGMACYVCVRRKFRVNGQFNMDFFAPPDAICSPAFYLPAWNKARLEAMNAVMRHGVPKPKKIP